MDVTRDNANTARLFLFNRGRNDREFAQKGHLMSIYNLFTAKIHFYSISRHMPPV